MLTEWPFHASLACVAEDMRLTCTNFTTAPGSCTSCIGGATHQTLAIARVEGQHDSTEALNRHPREEDCTSISAKNMLSWRNAASLSDLRAIDQPDRFGSKRILSASLPFAALV